MGNSNSCTCSQNSAVNLVCPLDIQGSCDTSIWGDLNQNSESSTNVGLFNWALDTRISGGSFFLGLFCGLGIALTIQYVKYRQARKKKKAMQENKQTKSRSRDSLESEEDRRERRSRWRLPRPQWPAMPDMSAWSGWRGWGMQPQQPAMPPSMQLPVVQPMAPTNHNLPQIQQPILQHVQQPQQPTSLYPQVAAADSAQQPSVGPGLRTISLT